MMTSICCKKAIYQGEFICPIHNPDRQTQEEKIAELKKEIHDFRSIDRHKDKDWGEWYKAYFEKVDSVKALTAEMERLKKESFSLLPHELCNEKIKGLTAEIDKLKGINANANKVFGADCDGLQKTIALLTVEVNELKALLKTKGYLDQVWKLTHKLLKIAEEGLKRCVSDSSDTPERIAITTLEELRKP